jgi:hypothetical protein
MGYAGLLGGTTMASNETFYLLIPYSFLCLKPGKPKPQSFAKHMSINTTTYTYLSHTQCSQIPNHSKPLLIKNAQPQRLKLSFPPPFCTDRSSGSPHHPLPALSKKHFPSSPNPV